MTITSTQPVTSRQAPNARGNNTTGRGIVIKKTYKGRTAAALIRKAIVMREPWHRRYEIFTFLLVGVTLSRYINEETGIEYLRLSDYCAPICDLVLTEAQSKRLAKLEKELELECARASGERKKGMK